MPSTIARLLRFGRRKRTEPSPSHSTTSIACCDGSVLSNSTLSISNQDDPYVAAESDVTQTLGVFSKLPREIRNMIWALALETCCKFAVCHECRSVHRQHWDGISMLEQCKHGARSPHPTVQILRVSHSIYDEARQFLYANNEFVILSHCVDSFSINWEARLKCCREVCSNRFSAVENTYAIINCLKFLLRLLETMGRHNTVFVRNLSIVLIPYGITCAPFVIFKHDWIQALQLIATEILSATAFDKCHKSLRTIWSHLEGSRLSGISFKVLFANDKHGVKYCHTECIQCWNHFFAALTVSHRLASRFRTEAKAAGILSDSDGPHATLDCEDYLHSRIEDLFNSAGLPFAAKTVAALNMREPRGKFKRPSFVASPTSIPETLTMEIAEDGSRKLKNAWLSDLIETALDGSQADYPQFNAERVSNPPMINIPTPKYLGSCRVPPTISANVAEWRLSWGPSKKPQTQNPREVLKAMGKLRDREYP